MSEKLYLYAFCEIDRKPATALVREHDDMEKAQEDREVQAIAWSDEGIEFLIHRIELRTTHTYDEMQERMMK